MRANLLWWMLRQGKTEPVLTEIARLQTEPYDASEPAADFRLLFAKALVLQNRANDAISLYAAELDTLTPAVQLQTLQHRYQILTLAEKYEEAWKTCEQIVSLQKDLKDATPMVSERIVLLLHLDRGDEAVKLMLEAEALAAKNKPAAEQLVRLQNEHAYFRAVANQELDTASDMIQQAIDALQPQEESALLDTRGYIYYRQEKYEAGLQDLNRAIELQLAEIQSQLQFMRGDQLLEITLAKRQLNQGLAVMYYHRAMLHLALENKLAAERDLEQVRALGCSPDRHLF
jgi:hypothetical protein